MKALTDKLALVTGSTRGIGQQIALGLARQGCNLILHGRTEDHAKETCTLLQGLGVQVDVIGADLSSTHEVTHMIDLILEKYGYLDILYNNGAIYTTPRPIYDHPQAVWEQVMYVNLTSLVQLCNAFAPIMKRRGYGRIVNVSTSMRGNPSYAPYIISKVAVEAYTTELAQALRGTGVLVNILQPGWIRTDMGGPNASHAVADVLPGALVPALLPNDGPTGQEFEALA